MKAFIGMTDFDWFTHVSALGKIDEVNFWQPKRKQSFQALRPGEPFLFKLYSPLNFIVGGGFFAHSTFLSVGLAWNLFGQKNGAGSLLEMQRRIEQYVPSGSLATGDYQIGCVVLEQPFFFTRDEWIPAPKDWKPNIVRGKKYDLTSGLGKDLWEEVQFRLVARSDGLQDAPVTVEVTDDSEGLGLSALRLGEGSFRVVVIDAYGRRCAVTQERTLPALEAAQIKPSGEGGPRSIQNGILLRSDIRRLLDAGYVTISCDYRLEVSRRIREEFENGRAYYALEGSFLNVPHSKELQPAPEYIRWHNEHLFRS